MTIHQAGYEFSYGIKDAWCAAERSFIGYSLRAGQIAEKFFTEYEPAPQANTYTEDLFTIEGAVEILAFWGMFWYTPAVTNITKVWFDVYDQTLSVPITANGVDVSNMTRYSNIGRLDTAGNVAEFLDADQVRVVDGAIGIELLAPFICNAKDGAETVIRIHYTNDGSPMYFIAMFEAVWRSLIRGAGRVYGDWF